MIFWFVIDSFLFLFLSLQQSDFHGCPTVFDSARTCWPSTLPNTSAFVPCFTEFLGINYDSSREYHLSKCQKFCDCKNKNRFVCARLVSRLYPLIKIASKLDKMIVMMLHCIFCFYGYCKNGVLSIKLNRLRIKIEKRKR